MIFALIIDVIIAVLLSVTIYYCWRLNGFLQVLRNGRQDLAEAVQDFNEAVVKAEKSVDQLRQNSQAAVEKLSIKVEKAEFMADDLAYLIDKANKLADQLSGKIAPQAAPKPEPKGTPQATTISPKKTGIESLAKKDQPTQPHKATTTDQTAQERPKSKAELDLMQALKSIR